MSEIFFDQRLQAPVAFGDREMHAPRGLPLVSRRESSLEFNDRLLVEAAVFYTLYRFNALLLRHGAHFYIVRVILNRTRIPDR